MSHIVGHGCSSDLALLWLWCRPAAWIQPLAWEPPYATGAALKKTKRKTERKKKKEKKKDIVLISGVQQSDSGIC